MCTHRVPTAVECMWGFHVGRQLVHQYTLQGVHRLPTSASQLIVLLSLHSSCTSRGYSCGVGCINYVHMIPTAVECGDSMWVDS